MSPNRPTHIIIHHSAGADNQTLGWDDIRRFHLARGWQGIGYHLGVERIGDGFEVLMGRPWHIKGAHCKGQGMNHKSLGVCFIGNYDREHVPEGMLTAAAPHLAALCHLLHLPVANIRPHHSFWATACPGRYFPMDILRELVHDTLSRLRIIT